MQFLLFAFTIVHVTVLPKDCFTNPEVSYPALQNYMNRKKSRCTANVQISINSCRRQWILMIGRQPTKLLFCPLIMYCITYFVSLIQSLNYSLQLTHHSTSIQKVYPAFHCCLLCLYWTMGFRHIWKFSVCMFS